MKTDKEMFINVSAGGTRIALTELKKLVELHIERADYDRMVGNIYKGNTSPINKNSLLLKGIQPIGYYALRPFWKDGHHSGIYSFEMLRALCENLSGE